MQNQWQALNPKNHANFPTMVVIDDGFFPTDDSDVSPDTHPGYPDGSGRHPRGSAWGDIPPAGEVKQFGFHGTEVLSLLSSTTNNGIHIAGVAGPWANKPDGYKWGASYMPVRIGGRFPIARTPQRVIEAFDGAVLNRGGTRIVNISQDIDHLTDNRELENRIGQADLDQIVVVTGAGNHRETVPGDAWIRRFENVIVVGALNAAGTDFWNKDGNGTATGPGVDLYAPGEDLTILIGNHNGQNPVQVDSGTSFSAPMVSGVVAMMLNVDPSMDSWLVRDMLVKTADQITPLSGGTPVPRLNAIRAVSCAKTLQRWTSRDSTGGHDFWECNMGALGAVQGNHRINFISVPR